MSAYVELQEREFALEELGYTATRHQREVGAGYFDAILGAQARLDPRAHGIDRRSSVHRVTVHDAEGVELWRLETTRSSRLRHLPSSQSCTAS
jgi:hypothetical protein